MKVTEANNILRQTMKNLIVKMHAEANETKIISIVEKYINECSCNSSYDQVANINTLIRWYEAGDVKGFLGAIQHNDTLNHINKL